MVEEMVGQHLQIHLHRDKRERQIQAAAEAAGLHFQELAEAAGPELF